MPNPYTYTLPTDLPSLSGNLVHSDKLTAEINAVLAGSTLLSVDTTPTQLILTFDQTLTSGEKSSLDGGGTDTENAPASGGSVLGDHDGETFKFEETHYKKEFNISGLLSKESWWAHYDSGSDSLTYKVREIVYSYSQNVELQHVETTYDMSGNVVSTRTFLNEEDNPLRIRRWRKQ